MTSHDDLTRSELRPDRNLLLFYFLVSLLFGPFFFIALIPLFFRYETLRYRFDEEGVSMRWGLLFRREISLTYARIQDIHLSSNFIERWLGLGKVQIQTASGSASAEMTIEGLKNYGEIRDFLYSRMRGARAEPERRRAAAGRVPAGEETDELAAVLRQVASELRAIRASLERRS
ncbi:MAG TPA: PH domain-containing protein [Thermoanaerobaculia bacterium]|nr:PH domain-containing protein [Thermoanaerobaculia bacterium]